MKVDPSYGINFKSGSYKQEIPVFTEKTNNMFKGIDDVTIVYLAPNGLNNLVHLFGIRGNASLSLTLGPDRGAADKKKGGGSRATNPFKGGLARFVGAEVLEGFLILLVPHDHAMLKKESLI